MTTLRYRLTRLVRVKLNRPRFRTKTGRVLRDADIYALADEAERGYNPDIFKRRG